MRAMLLVCVLLTGCLGYAQKVRSLEPGMTQAQVVERLGRPDGQTLVEGQTVYIYSNRLISDLSPDRADYIVVFTPDGKVSEYGPGQIRPGPAIYWAGR